MSWLYRFFTKSDNEQVVTITAPSIQFTGAATLTGNNTVTGNQTVTGSMAVGGAATVIGNFAVEGGYFTVNPGTSRFINSPIYLGSGTKAIVFGTAGIDPINTGVDGYDKGSIFMGGTSNLYFKTDYSSTSWASVDAYD